MRHRGVALVGVVLVAAVIGGSAAGAWAASQPDRYSVTAVMAVAPSATVIDDAQIIDIVGSLDRGGVIATAAGIASSGSVREAALEQLGVEAGSLGDYEIDAVPVLSSSLFDIMVSGPDSELVAELTNAIGAQAQRRLSALYSIYQVEFVTQAVPPTNSDRPSVLLITLLGALVAGGATTAVSWAAFAGRWRRSRVVEHGG